MDGKTYLLGFLIMVSIYNFLKRSVLGGQRHGFIETLLGFTPFPGFRGNEYRLDWVSGAR